MTIKNKKAQSTEYDKKRKLTKLNKDTNLGNGKVWVNRIKKIIIEYGNTPNYPLYIPTGLWTES